MEHNIHNDVPKYSPPGHGALCPPRAAGGALLLAQGDAGRGHQGAGEQLACNAARSGQDHRGRALHALAHLQPV